MTNFLKVVFAITAGLLIGSILYHPSNADKATPSKPLIFAWILKPPYATTPSNGSSDSKAHGMIREALLRHIQLECGWLHEFAPTNWEVDTLKVDSEFGMIELLRQNKVHVALPIFENPTNRRYSEFPYFKLDDYPGSEYITTVDDTSTLTVALDAVIKAWPLLAVTIVLTAIAGIIMWALDTYWNSEEFPRSFFKGSWDGFWWSFISMTTVGYGDKSPKSVVARIFSIIWIMLGLITMAIFTANVTSALTAVSLELTPSSLNGIKVGVLNNGTEYQHARQEGAQPQAYETIEGIIQALNSKEVEGMFLDRYTASYYQTRDKLKSLITVTNFEFRRDIGVLFSKDRKDLADCLTFLRSDIVKVVQTITPKYKLTPQNPTKDVSLFKDSSPFVKQFLYVSLGVLGGLLLTGAAWEIFIRKKARTKQDVVLGKVNGGMSTERETIRSDVEAARTIFRQMEDHLNKLEAKVTRF